MVGRRGRRTKLTPELQDQICTLLANHNSKQSTCQILGISRTAFYQWMRKGEREEGRKYIQFCKAVNKAQAQSVMVLTNAIANAPSWKAAAWLLERLHPEEFGRRRVIEYITPDDEPPVKVEHSGETASPVQIIIQSTGEVWQGR
jgi:hypothetical protein